MPRFRKRPVEIEAAPYPGHTMNVEDILAFEDWIEPLARRIGKWPLRYRGQQLIIPTLEGEMAADPGDFIICGVQGELYPCKPGIFAVSYEAVDAAG